MNKYDFKKIEGKWQANWEKNKTFLAKENVKKPKKFILVEFPYPSGAGLHMGHLRPYVAGDVYSRFSRMKGFETLFPIGWDAFGLPAENYAIKMGVHPSITTKKNVANAKKQMLSWGLSFDWSREINTTDPEYYKWTQWLFLQFYKKGLAYEATGVINWCPKDKTGLANEEVVDGKCERCGTLVQKKELRQWYLRITAYAEKLLEGLKNLPEWPEAVKLQQENWIGKSIGAEIDFLLNENLSLKDCLVVHGLSGHVDENWFPWLKGVLSKRKWSVNVPLLPKADHPILQEWIDTLTPLIKPNGTVIGHSLGAPAVLHAIQVANIKLDKLILIAPVNSKQNWKYLKQTYPKADWDAVKNFVNKSFDWEKIQKLVKNIIVYYSDNDEYIPEESIIFYKQNLPQAIFKMFPGKQHFNRKAGLIEFPEILEDLFSSIKIFTTRPDTIFGATYMVVAPEHPLVEKYKNQISNFKEVQKYIEKAKAKAEMERTAEGKEKTGVELKGLKAINPATKEEIPLYVADYVLWGYGTGAIMAVPAHDQRDFEFATKYKLPIVQVVENGKQELEKASAEYGVVVNSEKFNGLKTEDAILQMAEEFGKMTVQYKLRDWVFSRQRYWGEPIPLVHCEDCGIVPVPEKDLPVKLPNVKKYEPTGTGESPLADIKKWLKTKCPKCKKLAWRETNTMPQWAGSSWYWLRYSDPKNKKKFADIKKLKYWQPVDVYFGGMEHTTLHLLYSRFWNLFLKDMGLVTEKEPYKKRHPHGIVLAADGEKMSKSRGNVVDPQTIVKSHGADTLRMYELFLGPHELSVSWNDQGVVGVKRFLDRAWDWVNKVGNEKQQTVSEKAEKLLHKLIKKITEDIETFRFNTAISAFMEFYNQVRDEKVSKEFVQTFLKLLYPFAPHISEELNFVLGNKKSLQKQEWPKYDETKIIDTVADIIVQVNGKVRGKVQVGINAEEDEIKVKALELPAVKQALLQETIKRAIYIKGRLINLVI